MDLTIATPISFGISKSIQEKKYVKSVAPRTRRAKNTVSNIDRKERDSKRSFFQPSDKETNKINDTEFVSGTTWHLSFKIGVDEQQLKADITTKELKAFLLSDGTTARATTAIAWIDSTLALDDTHEDKYALYTAVDYNIVEFMTRVKKSAIFDGTEIGNVAKHYIDVLYADQLLDNANHQARVALAENFDLTEDSLAWLENEGIKIK
jgi:hypothetical protein